jgi:hypothetical protein
MASLIGVISSISKPPYKDGAPQVELILLGQGNDVADAVPLAPLHDKSKVILMCAGRLYTAAVIVHPPSKQPYISPTLTNLSDGKRTTLGRVFTDAGLQVGQTVSVVVKTTDPPLLTVNPSVVLS